MKEYTLKLSTDQVGEVLRDYGRGAVANRKGFVMVRFVGEKDKLAKLVSVFPEGPTGWNIYPSGQVGGNRFGVTGRYSSRRDRGGGLLRTGEADMKIEPKKLSPCPESDIQVAREAMGMNRGRRGR